ncbi:MAG: YHYH protein [Myxococcota bacterium]
MVPQLVRLTALAFIASLATAALGCGADDSDDGADTGDGMADETADNGAPDQDYVDGVLGALWADDVALAVGSEAIVLTSDGLPNHDVLEAYALMNTDDTAGVVASDTTLTIPLTPEWSDTVTETGLGTIGLAISGAVYFNPYEGDGTSVALDGNFEVGGIPFLDSCNGHPLPDETTYHYHGVPYCITDVVDTAGEHSVMIGVLAFSLFECYSFRGT